jgi:hypothetical protein
MNAAWRGMKAGIAGLASRSWSSEKESLSAKDSLQWDHALSCLRDFRREDLRLDSQWVVQSYDNLFTTAERLKRSKEGFKRFLEMADHTWREEFGMDRNEVDERLIRLSKDDRN